MARQVRVVVAAAVAVGAFALYFSTLLPGFDFGDTASFQVMAGSPAITPRDGYPLYFAIGSLFTRFVTSDPAYALNLASAAAAAVACGLIVLLAFELTASLPAAVVAAAVFGGSYTFWTQSVIAEVYALHICLVAGVLLLLLRWERQPTTRRLTLFFAAYALAFGNHLSMILLLPGCALFLLQTAPGGWRTMIAPRIVALALAIAAVGSLQYVWNVHSLWLMPQAPANVANALNAFWFDVTKADWRETMVFDVPPSMTVERLRMYWFDVVQQFGWLFAGVSLVGLYGLARQYRRRAILIGTVYLTNVIFALAYSVGDSHVFFLPSHLMIALLVAPGLLVFDRAGSVRGPAFGLIRALQRVVPRALPRALQRTLPGWLAAVLALTIAGVHIFHEYPAVDRSSDQRPRELLDALAKGLDDQHEVLLTDLNWQLQNGLTYYTKYVRSDLASTRMPDVLLYAPALIQDNDAIHRNIVVTERARDELQASFGPLFSATPDPRASSPSLSDTARAIPKGTRYVLCALKPIGGLTVDAGDLANALAILTGGRTQALPRRDYAAVAGIAGEDATEVMASDQPFRRATLVGGVGVEVRMESWLTFDTIRRMGFGQVVAARRHTLIVERGISFAAFDAQGQPIQTAYRANIFAPQPRWLIAPR